MTVTVDFTTGTSGQILTEIQRPYAAGAADFPDGHPRTDTQGSLAVGEHNPPALAEIETTPSSRTPVLAPTQDFPNGHRHGEVHPTAAVGDQEPSAPASGDATPTAASPVLASNPWDESNGPLLAFLADVLDDIENTRKANENRLRQLTRDEADADGGQRGFGLPLDQPQVAAIADMVEALRKLEHQAVLNLQRAVRKHPLGSWIKNTVGVGEKQGGRLIAAIGDPYWNTLRDRPRLVAELWAYCGLHVLPVAQSRLGIQTGSGGGGKQGDPDHHAGDAQESSVGVAPTRARGQRANWSTVAKTRAYLIAESCIKQDRSPYRAVYDDGRTKYADSVHQAPCRRCGPTGKPAEIGSPLSAGHQHARALRLVMKAVLRDLWLESKRIHEQRQPA